MPSAETLTAEQYLWSCPGSVDGELLSRLLTAAPLRGIAGVLPNLLLRWGAQVLKVTVPSPSRANMTSTKNWVI